MLCNKFIFFFVWITFEDQKLFILSHFTFRKHTGGPLRVTWSCGFAIHIDGQLPYENGKSSIVYNNDMNEVRSFLIFHMVSSLSYCKWFEVVTSITFKGHLNVMKCLVHVQSSFPQQYITLSLQRSMTPINIPPKRRLNHRVGLNQCIKCEVWDKNNYVLSYVM